MKIYTLLTGVHRRGMIIIELPNSEESANDFKFVLVEGRQVDNPFVNKVREFLFSERDGRYRFKLGMIPTTSGDFTIDASNSAGTYRKHNKCTKAGLSIMYCFHVR